MSQQVNGHPRVCTIDRDVRMILSNPDIYLDYSNLEDLTTSLSTFSGAVTMRLRRNDLLPVYGKNLTTPFNSSKRHRFPVRQDDFSFASRTVWYISSTGSSKPS